MKKAATVNEVRRLVDIPNVGPAIAADLRLLGINDPKELRKCTGFGLYQALCKKTKTRHDPCVLDTFLAVVDFMQGAPARPWFYYTKERKQQYPDL